MSDMKKPGTCGTDKAKVLNPPKGKMIYKDLDFKKLNSMLEKKKEKK